MAAYQTDELFSPSGRKKPPVLYRRNVRRAWFGRILGLTLALLMLYQGTAQAQIAKLDYPDTTAGNFFGVAVSLDGSRALVGASGENACGTNSGAAYVFDWDATAGAWQKTARLVAEDCAEGNFFGRSVSVSGDRALIGSARDFFATKSSNAAYLFERDSTTGEWEQVARLTADPRYEEGAFAASVSLDGARALITTTGDPSGRQYPGAAYIFERDPRTGVWERAARFTGSGSLKSGIFGGTGDLDGDRVVVAASTYFADKPGSVYIFERDPGTNTWKEVERFSGIDDFFISLDIEGDRVLVGESRHGRNDSGAASVYERSASGEWRRTTTIRPRSPYDHGAFGTNVSLYGDRALIVGYDEQLGFDFNIDRVVYVYKYDPDAKDWAQQRVIDVGEVFFGSSVDHNERLALVGEASEQKPGAAYVVRLPGGEPQLGMGDDSRP